jgi:hypothetical protein
MVGVIVGLVKSLIDRSNDALNQARASSEGQLAQQTAELRRLREVDLPRFGGHGVVRRPWPLTLE